MQHRRFEDADSLLAYVNAVGDTVLYRGQTTHYEVSGDVVIKPSQHRKGCVPATLRAWTHYVVDACRRLSEHNELTEDVDLMQALLQHYGWRSFYIDATDSIGIAAWFAGSVYTKRVMIDRCDDSNGEEIQIRQEAPTYVPNDAQGHLYLISRDALTAESIPSINLSERLQGSVHTRFVAQRAWLIGPMRGPIPPRCIVVHIEAPGAVMREVARRSGLVETLQLFPPRSRDAVLKVLLSSPWQLRFVQKGIPAFARRLELPEYDYEFTKVRPSSEAFVTPFWVADRRARFKPTSEPSDSLDLDQCTFFRITEDILYLENPRKEMPKIPKVLSMLKREKRIIIESDGLIRMSDDLDGCEYDKGVSVELVDDTVIQVSAFAIDHPGTRIRGAAVNMPFFYSFDHEGNLQRVEREGQCNCRDPWRHRQHVEVLGKFEYVIDSFVRIADRDYGYQETRPISLEDLMRQRPR